MPPDPRSLCPQLNLLNPPPEKNSWVCHCSSWCTRLLLCAAGKAKDNGKMSNLKPIMCPYFDICIWFFVSTASYMIKRNFQNAKCQLRTLSRKSVTTGNWVSLCNPCNIYINCLCVSWSWVTWHTVSFFVDISLKGKLMQRSRVTCWTF